MNRSPIKLILLFIIGLLSAFLVRFYISDLKSDKGETQKSETAAKAIQEAPQLSSIEALTSAQTVIDFVKTHHQLPDFYITKHDARKMGWIAAQGNWCDVLPGKALGGDPFGNRENKLPTGKQYFEADVNVRCGRRNGDRIVYTLSGEVWLTENHYQSFRKQ